MGQSGSLGVLLDHVQDKIVVLDETGHIEYVNAGVTRDFGYERAELVGEDAFEYVHPDDTDAAQAMFERTIASDTFTATSAEYRFRASDGSWVWLESQMSNLTDHEMGYVVSSRDITDRVLAERERDETTARLEELASVTSDVLWMFSGDWSELLFVNPAYESIYGHPVERVREDPSSFLETIHPEDRPHVEEAMDCLASGTAVDMEYRVNPDHDYDTWVWVQGEPIVRDGDVVRIAGFSRDITDRYRRRRQLAVMDKLLRHNVRNDLTTILGQAELIEETVPEASERVAVIRRTGEALLATAEKQRDIIEILTEDVCFETQNVRDIADRSAGIVVERFDTANVVVDSPSSVPACVLPQLQLALVELIENGVRYSDSDTPTVDVRVRQDGTSVVVDIRDGARPLPDNEAEVLTGGHEMSDIYHSTGLGLWLVYWVIELMNGSITVDREKAGNRIRLRFPAQSRTTPVED